MRRWHRFAIPLGAVALVFAVTGVAYAVNEPDPSDPAFLSPLSADGIGGQRLAQALAARGVRVERETRTSDALASAYEGDATLFLPVPRVVHPDYLAMLRLMPPTTRIVLVDPARRALDDTGLPLVPGGRRWAAQAAEPGCELEEARAAGRAAALRQRYEGNGTRCYGTGVVRLIRFQSDFVVIGASDPFRNDRIGEHGNRALATGLLATRSRVVWLDLHELESPPGVTDDPGSASGVPPSRGTDPAEGDSGGDGSSDDSRSGGGDGSAGSPEDDSSGGPSASGVDGENPLWDAFPAWFWALLIQLALAVVLLALWRARRLGAPVTEPLPVTVRAAETVHGRGRLYRRAKARGPTADLLRAAARDRLAQLLAPSPEMSLVDAAAAATGRDREQIEGLLDGPTPESDDDLRRLQADLDALVEAVRRAR
ncbi:DUF4350 domain-containing protein [Phytohabitans sp. ZYX-F-186]|uniref:DUF4350 domain-containing protein n=1 Tax=Phytohabitans maris TaxID=3071409 RepID=A0ABU0ZL43_9ACTN|nr:DUF4350 domain-containing protein [Phytohabitans sp. ZYX-F-186]MDQ7907768.1 DUF4350 domain-containing protein [Phytohabitans sp. ZYX-F-186]